MTAQANTRIDVESLPFEQRLTRVQSHIKRRISKLSPRYRHAARARMWGNWLRREVLS